VNTKVKKMIIIIQRFICALENPEFLLRTWKTLENPGIDFFFAVIPLSESENRTLKFLLVQK